MCFYLTQMWNEHRDIRWGINALKWPCVRVCGESLTECVSTLQYNIKSSYYLIYLMPRWSPLDVTTLWKMRSRRSRSGGAGGAGHEEQEEQVRRSRSWGAGGAGGGLPYSRVRLRTSGSETPVLTVVLLCTVVLLYCSTLLYCRTLL